MSSDFAEALDEVARRDARALLVHADGDDFSLGGDIADWPDAGVHELRAMFEAHLRTFNRFETLSIPTIVAVNGRCLGGGLELVLRSDVVFAADSAKFGHPEQMLGIVTILGGVYRMAERIGRAKAMELAMTAEQLSATEMERLGVVNRVLPAESLLEDARAFADRVASGPTRAHATHKALLRIWGSGGVAVADAAVLDLSMPLFETDDARGALRSATEALKAGRTRPAYPFEGR